MNFAGVEQLEEARRPRASTTVTPAMFCDTWIGRPKSTYQDLEVGLRGIADADIQTARSQAASYALTLHPNAKKSEADRLLWIDAFNDALMRWIIARGTCELHDASKSWSVWAAAPEDIVREALTSDGVRAIYDEWEKMRIFNDPMRRCATVAELDAALADLDAFKARLAELEGRDATRAARVARLLGFIFDELRT